MTTKSIKTSFELRISHFEVRLWIWSTVLLTFLIIISFHAPVNTQTKSKSPASSVSVAQVIESGKFRIYELKQVQGEESYEIRREPGGLVVKARMDLPFWGEELKTLLNATLRMKDDLTPEQFEIKGIRPLEVRIDTSVNVQGRTATVREDKSTKQVMVPENFFTLAGYAPVTIEMMLFRYWFKHGLQTRLQLLPAGEAFIERRGRDTVMVGNKSTPLDRYNLSGSNWGAGWGKQTLWFDSENRLAAVVNIGGDVETNFSAIRDGYDSALSFFLKRTVEDGIDRLTESADRLSLRRNPKGKNSLALVGATLIDVTGKPPIANSAVVIEGDRITAAGQRSEIKIPEGATTVDVTGKYLLPGLWDMHAHLYQVEFGPAYLAAGITTARDVGNDFEFDTSMRDAAKEERGLGPRLLLAGYIDGKNDGHSFDVQVDTPAEARAAVQRYKDAGYEQIKIRDHVKLEILKVITAEAHRLGMTVTGHVPQNMNAIDAVQAGMDQINHLNFVYPVLEPKSDGGGSKLSNELDSPRARQSLQIFKERHTVIDPTMATLELMIRPKNMAIETFEPGMAKVAPELVEQLNKKGTPPETASQMRTALEYLLLIIRALYRSGIPIVAGTDVSVPAHSLHRELELYVKAGLTPLEAIQTATLTPARVMKLENEVGTIEAGKRADIIILDANPLDNISNIRKVRFVVTQGRLFVCARLWESVGFKP
jgi:imidazolonepropionase-like amidohydrolase